MAHRTLTTESDRVSFLRFVEGVKLPHTFEWQPGRDRTRDQNALQWLWATEAAHQRGDMSSEEVQREWKLRHGVPILREDSADFRELYDSHVRPLPYERKIKFMDMLDVTSAMKVRQMVRFLDAVQRECAELGIKLTNPDPELAAYQARYRTKDRSAEYGEAA
jgi:hypothetical protein